MLTKLTRLFVVEKLLDFSLVYTATVCTWSLVCLVRISRLQDLIQFQVKQITHIDWKCSKWHQSPDSTQANTLTLLTTEIFHETRLPSMKCHTVGT